MNDQFKTQPLEPKPSVERLEQLSEADLNDLCDATDAAIEGGGGFGWIDLPSREILERYWNGVVTMPARVLIVARLDGVICGTCQLVEPPKNNEAQAHAVHLTTNFMAPWARGQGLSGMLLDEVDKVARDEGFSVINLDVRETMEAAMKLYETKGFIRIGEHPHYAEVGGETLKGYYYYKEIS